MKSKTAIGYLVLFILGCTVAVILAKEAYLAIVVLVVGYFCGSLRGSSLTIDYYKNTVIPLVLEKIRIDKKMTENNVNNNPQVMYFEDKNDFLRYIADNPEAMSDKDVENTLERFDEYEKSKR